MTPTVYCRSLSLLAMLGSACAVPPAPGLAQVIRTHRGGAPALELAAPGLRVNALLPPALEFADRSVLRLTRGARTPDSAYFAEPPWAPAPNRPLARALLRLSYCQQGERVCRSVALPVTIGSNAIETFR